MLKAEPVGSQRQLTRCFRELEVTSQKNRQKVDKLEEWCNHMLTRVPWQQHQ